MDDDSIPPRMDHFRVRLPGPLIAAIVVAAEQASRIAGYRITPSALVRLALLERFAVSPHGAASLPGRGA